MLEFGVLGSVRAVRDGAGLDLGGPRQRSVLARLLVAGDRAVPAEVLVADLWNADVQPRAMSLLQVHVSMLRRVLEPDRAPRAASTVLVTEPPGYALRAGSAVDAVRLESLAAEGDDLRATDPAAAADRYAAAGALWRGPAYADFADEEWARPEVARLDELRLHLVEAEASARLAAGQTAQTVALLQPHTAAQPLREEGWRLLALGLYRGGRQADALAALRTARARLVDELGLDPGPELRALEDDILAQAEHLRPAEPAAVVRAARPDPPRDVSAALVGREREVAALDRAVQRAADGVLGVAVVSGEAGGGKTALLDDVVRRRIAAGWTTCVVRCPETEGAPSGWPWLEALRTLAVEHPPPDELAAWLADDGQQGDVVQSRFRVHRSVGSWLGGLSTHAPLLVVVDDLHRADEETVSLLVDLLTQLRSAAVAVVVGHRPEPTTASTRALAALAALDPVRVELTGLSPEAIDALVAELATGPLDAPTRALIAERTSGNPFFVRELVRLIGSGADAAAVPGGVRDVVRQRLAGLPADVGTLLRLAAVAGREVDADVLMAAGRSDSADEDAVVDALELGLVSGLLVEPAPGRLRFVHAIVRDTLYDDLSRLRATRWHGRIAAATEQLDPTDVTALAHHYGAAGGAVTAAAAHFAGEAAQLAEQRFAYADAADWWGRAAAGERAAHPEQVGVRLRLLARQIRAAQMLGDVSRSRALRVEALPAAAATDDPEQIAAIILAADVPTVWSPRSIAPMSSAMLTLAETCAARLTDRPDLRARLLAVVAHELEGELDPHGYAASLEAVAVARTSGDPEALAHALYARYLHTYRDGIDGVAERGAVGTELLELARRHGLAVFETTARLVLLQYACARSDFVAADEHAAEAHRLATAYGLPLLGGIARWYGGLRLAIAGDWAEAERIYTRSAAEVTATGFYQQSAQMTWLVSVWFLWLVSGRYEQIADLTAAAAVDAPAALRQDVSELVAVSLLAAGRRDEAVAAAAERFPIRPDYFMAVSHALRGLLGVALDDAERVAEAYAVLLPYRDTLCGAETGTVSLGPTATVLARLAAYQGDSEAAKAHRAVAIAVAASTGNERWIAQAEGVLRSDDPWRDPSETTDGSVGASSGQSS